jgi:hypothetical protein
MNMNGKLMAAALVGLGLLGSARAQDRTMESQTNTATQGPMSYTVGQSEVKDLRGKGWSWRDIGYGVAIAERSGKPLQEVVSEKNSGLRWREVADRNGFRLKEVKKEAKRFAKEGKKSEKYERRQGGRSMSEPRDEKAP